MEILVGLILAIGIFVQRHRYKQFSKIRRPLVDEGVVARILNFLWTLPSASMLHMDWYEDEYHRREHEFLKNKMLPEQEFFEKQWAESQPHYGRFGKWQWKKDHGYRSNTLWDKFVFSLPMYIGVRLEKFLKYDFSFYLLVLAVLAAIGFSAHASLEAFSFKSVIWIFIAPISVFIVFVVQWYFQPIILAFLSAFFVIDASESFFRQVGMSFMNNLAYEVLSSPQTVVSAVLLLLAASVSTVVDLLDIL